MSALSLAAAPSLVALVRVDLDRMVGFLVSDARGRVVGRVEGLLHSPEAREGLVVRSVVFRWRRCLVTAPGIAAIDDRTKLVGLRIERDEIEAFA